MTDKTLAAALDAALAALATSLPPGSRSSATVYAGHGDSSTCSLDALQDGDGNQINVTGGAL